MNTAAFQVRPFRINWLCVQKNVRLLGMLAFAFALGGWVVSIRDQAASIPYRDRSTKQLEVIHKEVGANPVAQIRCDRKVAAAVVTALAVKRDPNIPLADVLPVNVCPPPHANVPK